MALYIQTGEMATSFMTQQEEHDNMFNGIQEQLDRMKAHLENLAKPTESTATSTPSCVKALEPQPYARERGAMLIKNFLWDLRCHVDANIVSESEKVFLTSLYLAGHAKNWWRLQVKDTSRALIESWADWAQEFKAQFCPANSGQATRTSMRQLKHNGFIQEYVEKFSMLILEVPQIDEEEKLHYFMEGLQLWAQNKLR